MTKTLGLVVTLLLGLLCEVGMAQESSARAAALRPLEKVCRDLAAADRPAELAAVRRVLEDLGYAEKAMKRLDRALESTKTAKPSGAERLCKQAVTGIDRAIKKLGARMDAEPDAREMLARAILVLDSDHAEAREVLGDLRVDGRWVSAAEAERAERRQEIVQAIRNAHALPVEISVVPNHDKLLLAVSGEPGLRLEHGKVRITTTWPRLKAERVLRECLRLTALSNFLVHGKLEVPDHLQLDAYLLGSRPMYDEALRIHLEADQLEPFMVEAAPRASTYWTKAGVGVFYTLFEGYFIATFGNHLLGVWVDGLHDEREQPCLIAAHANWLCLRYVGAPMPGLVWAEGDALRESGDSARTRAAARREAEREEMRILETAGFAGARSWLRWQVQNGEDPPLSRAMVDRLGKIGKDELLKMTFVLDYLHGLGKLEPLLAGTRQQVGKPVAEIIAAFEKALGRSLSEFEDEWRAWMLAGDPGVLQRLGGRAQESGSREARAMLEYLEGIRDAAISHLSMPEVRELRIDTELSEGAARHVAYLAIHPQQLEAWPDAHEEYPDKEGFSAAGSWAGLNSVICPGVDRPSEALDNWMGTFYHRLPLLDPGLLRVGWAMDDGIAVLDCESIKRDILRRWQVVWPHDGMTKVPCKFSPELPNPVPGEDQSRWGYPATLTLKPETEGPVIELTMELRRRAANGPLVDCWLSSPRAPTNPDLVPDHSWCLIPKQPLEPGTTYYVEVIFVSGDREPIRWSFRT